MQHAPYHTRLAERGLAGRPAVPFLFPKTPDLQLPARMTPIVGAGAAAHALVHALMIRAVLERHRGGALDDRRRFSMRPEVILSKASHYLRRLRMCLTIFFHLGCGNVCVTPCVSGS